ncbi:PP2C family protein-serine/threonine phosphatase [Alkaliphilus crotonatoxidans]
MERIIVENTYEIIIILISILLVLIITRELIKLEFPENQYRFLDLGQASYIGDREYQEDAMEVVHTTRGTLAIVADGRGKNKAGRISSGMAVKIFTELFIRDSALANVNYYFKRAFNITNQKILDRLGDQRGGASLACAIIDKGLLYYASVGNTRMAVFRNNQLISLNEGHTVNVLARKGFYQGKISRETALTALKEKRVLNYVGQEGFKEVEVYDVPVRLKTGDTVLLMSDGVYEHLPEHKLETALKAKGNSQNRAEAIISLIKETAKEERDNASIILIKYKGN